ncbi:MAG: hypothetical protein WAZ44_04220 [Minisyncoccia bacterium]
MNTKQLTIWFSIVSGILVLFGFLYVFFGLGVLPVDKKVLLDWESGLYGAIMIGWGVNLFLVGRIAFKRNDMELMRSLLYGVVAWLFFEAGVSAYLGVWFNVGVDVGVLALFSFPIIKVLRSGV